MVKASRVKSVFLAFLLGVALIAHAGMTMADSWNGVDVTLNGTYNTYPPPTPNWSATILGNGNLQLTNAANEAGAAWVNTPIPTANSFTTTFNFTLTYAPPLSGWPLPAPQADGITFAFQNSSTSALGTGGGSLGVGGIPSAAGSAIQTWSNNTVGFFGPGQDPAALTIKAAPFDLGDTSPLAGSETISYNAVTTMLTMTGQINGSPVSDSLAINLASVYGATVYAGFTGGSGVGGSDQEITYWSGITAVPVPPSMLLLAPGLLGLVGMRRRFKK